jgi:LysM repeat protein
MDLEHFEEEKPKIPTNLLVFVIVSALVIAFSIYYISKSGKQRPLTTEEIVESDTLATEESTETSEENGQMASSDSNEQPEEEELGSEDAKIIKSIKSEKSAQTEISSEKPTEKTPTKTVNLEEEKKVVKKQVSSENKKAHKTENIKGILHVHTVRKNEFLSTLASMYNFPIQNIKELNGIDEDIRAGQKIKVKIQAIHKVKKGEQLAVIAKNYGVKVDDICKINGIKKNSSLKENQKLVIPLKPRK